MKKRFTKILVLLIASFASTIFAGAIIINLSAESNGENITLKWQTTQESNLSYFVVERKSISGSFGVVSETILSTGNNSSYEFVDENAFKSSDAVFIYRLKIIDVDNQVTYSGEISVTHSVSSVKRTWGSIKALFR